MSPNLLTSSVATEVIASHSRAADNDHRIGQNRGRRFRIRRRSAASRGFTPRGRTIPPFAH